jgi:hypothetical protein
MRLAEDSGPAFERDVAGAGAGALAHAQHAITIQRDE